MGMGLQPSAEGFLGDTIALLERSGMRAGAGETGHRATGDQGRVSTAPSFSGSKRSARLTPRRRASALAT